MSTFTNKRKRALLAFSAVTANNSSWSLLCNRKQTAAAFATTRNGIFFTSFTIERNSFGKEFT